VNEQVILALKRGDYLTVLHILSDVKYDGYDSLIATVHKHISINKLVRVQAYSSTKEYVDTDELYKSEKRLSSYRVRGKIWLIDNNVILSVNWHLYRRLLVAYKKDYLIEKFNIEARLKEQKLLKELSTYALRMGPALDDFIYLVGIELLFGFNYEAINEDQTERLKAWVSNDFKPNFNGSYTDFRQLFRTEMKSLLLSGAKVVKTVSVSDFSANVAGTGTPGSAYDPGGPRATFMFKNFREKLYNNKYSKSIALSHEEKIKRIKHTLKQKAKVTVKVEPIPKVRLIVSSDYNTFIMMRYIDTWLDQILSGLDCSVLWRSEQSLLNFWLRFSQLKDEWAIPIDQTAFDHHVLKDDVTEMNDVLIECIKETVPDSDPNKQDLLDVSKNLRISFEDSKIYYTKPDGDTVVLRWSSGVLSGWDWTAKLDTLVNIVQGRIARHLCNQLGLKIGNFTLYDAMGDDQEVRFEKLSDAILFWLSLSSMGYEIHPMKNFISNRHDEYLRRVSIKGLGVTGYPCRMINKICWRYPGKTEVEGWNEKVNTIYDRWTKLGRRMGTMLNPIIRTLILEDIKGAKLNVDDVCGFYATPRIYGGRESQLFRDSGNREYSTLPGSWVVKVSFDDDIGYRQFKEMFGEYQIRELDDWIKAVTAVPLVDRHIELKTHDLYGIGIREEVEALAFIIGITGAIVRPRIIEGWPHTAVFGKNDDLMRKLFPDIETFRQQGNAPKSWIYDLVTNNLKIPLPELDNISDEGVSLLARKYINSLIFAMYRKRRCERKWIRLVKYFVNHIGDIIKSEDIPRMFNL
jgi:hypothetical protein